MGKETGILLKAAGTHPRLSQACPSRCSSEHDAGTPLKRDPGHTRPLFGIRAERPAPTTMKGESLALPGTVFAPRSPASPRQPRVSITLPRTTYAPLNVRGPARHFLTLCPGPTTPRRVPAHATRPGRSGSGTVRAYVRTLTCAQLVLFLHHSPRVRVCVCLPHPSKNHQVSFSSAYHVAAH